MPEWIKIAVFICLIYIAVTIPFYIFNISAVNNSRAGCERLNSVRLAQFDYYGRDSESRQETINEDRDSLQLLTSPNAEEKIFNRFGIRLNEATLQQSITAAQTRIKLNSNLVENDQLSRQDLIKSAEEFASPKGSVHVDCDEAYPYPWPID